MVAPKLIVAATILVPMTSGFAQSGFKDTCPNNAQLPFATIEVKHPIDNNCGLKGSPSATQNSQLQNSVKNNFCSQAPQGKPETFTLQQLIDLQKNAHIPSGRDQEPNSRDALKALGEGKVIRMKASLIEAHHADVGSGESVNCGGKAEEQNDVHIALGTQTNSKECESATAEVSPHFRPASWNEIGHFEKFNSATNKYVVDPGMASRLQAHSYRITGQLFFDASHAPCPCSTANCAGNPVRATLWEIHPVYEIEVCKAGAPCNENNDADWVAFDTWWKGLAPIQPVRPPHRHPPH
jgi:hypothetical protein